MSDGIFNYSRTLMESRSMVDQQALKDQKALSNILGINKKRTSVAPFTATPVGVVYDNNSGDPVTIL